MKKKIILTLILVILVAAAIVVVFNIANKGYTKEEINITIGNQKIYAVLYKPRKSGKMPIVIYSHGLGATYRSGSDYASKLSEYGIMTLCLDFRGGSDRSKSDGLTTEMSIVTEMNDLEAAIKEVKTWDFVDTENIILAGSSQGGIVSSLVSSRHHGDIKGLILLYPAMSLPDVMREWYGTLEKIPETVRLNDSIDVGRKYFTDIWDIDPYKEIENDMTNVLILHGTEDSLVSVDVSKRINNIYANSEFYVIEGAGHGFNGKHFNEAMEHIVNYLKEIKVIK